MNETILTLMGTIGPWGKGMERSISGSGGQSSKATKLQSGPENTTEWSQPRGCLSFQIERMHRWNYSSAVTYNCRCCWNI